ncbi:hypothetical protein EYF80_057023 [Liparis tanakae]|uniref:Uncharacterized protein n=1 Tax=Liparis tanakae TaxID=230148 RepID=A0A4Z2EX35_9TELE|nr:hypothetical protein EYF80_057023 [Liparis tanakae]
MSLISSWFPSSCERNLVLPVKVPAARLLALLLLLQPAAQLVLRPGQRQQLGAQPAALGQLLAVGLGQRAVAVPQRGVLLAQGAAALLAHLQKRLGRLELPGQVVSLHLQLGQEPGLGQHLQKGQQGRRSEAQGHL